MPGQFIRKLPRLPKWTADRIRWGLIYRAQQLALRLRSYDYESLFRIISELTGATPEAAKGYYEELFENGVLAEVKERIKSVPDLKSEHAHMRYLGVEKYVRLDRTVLYCVTRALKPKTFVETGTRWGLGSYFIARALEENGNGHLYTFDIGVEVSRSEYGWPDSQSCIGFLLPERLRQFVTLIEGDSLQTLQTTLDRTGEVCVYYFDSKQTIDHMLGEYRIVFPRMRPGGLFMSEDTDKNDAWDEFVKDKQFACQAKYCSHLGLTSEREVSAIRTLSKS